MPFEYETNLTALVNVLKNSNTTTATHNLSLSLSSVIINDNIQASDPEIITVRNDRLPSVFVRISNKDESFAGVGQTGVGTTRAKKEAQTEVQYRF